MHLILSSVIHQTSGNWLDGALRENGMSSANVLQNLGAMLLSGESHPNLVDPFERRYIGGGSEHIELRSEVPLGDE